MSEVLIRRVLNPDTPQQSRIRPNQIENAGLLSMCSLSTFSCSFPVARKSIAKRSRRSRIGGMAASGVQNISPPLRSFAWKDNAWLHHMGGPSDPLSHFSQGDRAFSIHHPREKHAHHRPPTPSAP